MKFDMRFDYYYSYWILFWYFLYYFNFEKTYNPKFVLIFALIENIIVLLFMFYYKTRLNFILLALVSIAIVKVIPLYTVWDTTIKMKDIYMAIFLFFIYLFWIYINKMTLKKIFNNTKLVAKGKRYFTLMSIIYNTFLKN